MGAAGIDRCINHARKALGSENVKSLIPDAIVQTHTVTFRILESQDDN